jgi:excisionase family DNA binding protein
MTSEQEGGAVGELMNVPEAASYLRMSKHWVYKKSAAGTLKVVKQGNRTFFRRADLDAYLASCVRGD